ncbi:extracellular solute-binding protein [Haloferacaceae archaeon DSL9]
MEDRDARGRRAALSGRRLQNRRRFLGVTGAALAGSVALAGCMGSDEEGEGGGSDDEETDDDGGTEDADDESDGAAEFDGDPVTTEGTDWENLPDLEGELTIYSGRREAQIQGVFDELESFYDGLTIEVSYDDNEAQLGKIEQEGENSPADILYTQDSGALGALKDLGRTVPLTDDVLETVPESWRDPEGTWTGVSGRTRCVAYNTDAWGAEDLPDDIFAYPEDDRFTDEMGWRVDSGSFLAWIRAMMITDGEDRTRQYLQDMENAGVNNYEGGSTTPEALAAGEVTVGFVNHYYVGRLLADQPDVPVDVTFTDGDIGSLFNVSGTAVLDSSDQQDLARNFVRHLLGRQGQEFFVDTNKEYAVIDGVEYVGDLPSLDELNPPEFDLNQLSDLEPAVDLLRDAGLR